MNRHVITGIIIVGIIFSLCFLVSESMKQNGDPKIAPKVTSFDKSAFTRVEPVIASFGLDENNPDRMVFFTTRNV